MVLKTQEILKQYNNIKTNSSSDGRPGDPFYGSSFKSLGGLDYLVGLLFILLALLSLFLFKKTRNYIENYKKRQLREYNKNRKPDMKKNNYQDTRLFLPMLQRMIQMSPWILCATFIVVAIVFFVHHPIQTL